MTNLTTTDLPTGLPTDPGPPIDLYREVHKGLRLALSDLVREVGSLDASDAESIGAFGSLFADLDMMLATHHAHEDGGHLDELIAQHVDADVVQSIHEAHDRFDVLLHDLRVAVAALSSGGADTARLYDDVVAFVAAYLLHMNVEEQQVMPALRADVDHDELFGITMEIRTSVPPPQMCVFLRYMLPAMNPDERAGTLGGMKAGAPPEIFDMFWGVAERSLAAGDLAEVADRIAS
jgi:hemerythrin-like domain-containing protein